MLKCKLFILRILLMVPLCLGAFSARVGLSALFTSIAGRYGGGVFRNWKGLTVLGVLPDRVFNPNSAKQAKARGLLSCTSKKWSGLAVAVKGSWSAVATYLTEQWDNFQNEVGTHIVIRTPRGPYTALGAVVSTHSLLGSCNGWDCEMGLIPPPVGTTAPGIPAELSCSGDTDGIVCVWTDPFEWGEEAEEYMIRVWCKSEDGVFFAQMDTFIAAGVETATITNLVPAGDTHNAPLIPGLYFVQLDAVNSKGFRGGPSAVFDLDIAAPEPP